MAFAPFIRKITESALFNESVVSVSSYAMVAYEELRRKYNLQISDDRQIIYNGCPVPSKIAHPFKIDNNKINIAFVVALKITKEWKQLSLH